MSDPKPLNRAKKPPVAVGEPWDMRFSATIMVGPKAVYTSGNVEHGVQGWSIVIDDESDCVWVGWQGWWTRVGWDCICYVRYRKPAEEKTAAA